MLNKVVSSAYIIKLNISLIFGEKKMYIYIYIHNEIKHFASFACQKIVYIYTVYIYIYIYTNCTKLAYVTMHTAGYSRTFRSERKLSITSP